MAATVRAQVRLPYKSGLPEDVATNTWHFTRATGTFDDCCDALVDGLTAFYGEFDNGLASFIEANDAVINFYDLTQPEPRVPRIEPLTLSIPDNANFPGEVALVLSFSGGAPVTASKRGRLYLGPFAQSAGTETTGVPCRPTTGMITAIMNGLTEMADAMSPTPGVVWNVYSRKNAAMTGVVRAWINNEFDTQRRRGHDETARTTVDVPNPISG